MNPINVSKSVYRANDAGVVSLPNKERRWDKPADLVIIFGPGVNQNMLMSVLDSAQKKCLTVKLIGDGERSLNLDDIAACRQSGAMGPATQVLVTMHGSRSDAGHRIEYGDRGEDISSADFMHLLRGTQPDGDTKTSEPEVERWMGTIHLMSCESGKMRDEIFNDKVLWRNGGVRDFV